MDDEKARNKAKKRKADDKEQKARQKDFISGLVEKGPSSGDGGVSAAAA